MSNPILIREFVATLRSRKALWIQVVLAASFAALVALRWPSESRVQLSGTQSQEVFRLFGYGLLTAVLLMVPVFPATSIVREKNSGTLALLLNSSLSSTSIYLGKFLGVFCFVLLLVAISLPAAAACFAMGGVSLGSELGMLYLLLIIASAQIISLGLLISTYVNSNDAGMRATYGAVLLFTVITQGPYLFLQGKTGLLTWIADWLRCVSPIPAVMETLGQSGVGAQGIVAKTDVSTVYLALAAAMLLITSILTIRRLNFTIFDQARDAGVITDDLQLGARLGRRLLYLIDPQRRKAGIWWFVNPVMVKEFRTRRFGRFHWLLRLVASCAVLSLLLTLATTTGTMDWGVETIGGIMVVLQVTLIVLLTPSLAAGLISTEIESGGWDLLRMTPISVMRIISGKLFSVVWTLLLLLLATVPGYVVMVKIKPGLIGQVTDVVICLGLTAVFAMFVTAFVSSLFNRTAVATVASYVVLVLVCAGTMLFWLGRDAPFGPEIVENALKINPMAAALNVIDTPGFKNYQLLPDNWWIMGVTSGVCLMLFFARVIKLSRPD